MIYICQNLGTGKNLVIVFVTNRVKTLNIIINAMEEYRKYKNLIILVTKILSKYYWQSQPTH